MNLKRRARVVDFPNKSHPPRVPTKDMIKHGMEHWDKVKGVSTPVNLLQAWIAMHDYWYRVEQFRVKEQELAELDGRRPLHVVR
jgi:hypothetical protein